MRNIFYFCKSAENPQKQILLNDEGCSPLNVGYGYCLTSNGSGNATAYAIVPVSSELSVVDRIFRDFISNKSIAGIVTKLNEENVPTRLKRGWNYNAVSNILKNENYIGTFTLNKYEILTANDSLKYVPVRKRVAHKETFAGLAVISDETWNKVQKIRLGRNHRLSKQYNPTSRRKKRTINKIKIKASKQPRSSKSTKSFPLIKTILNSLAPFAPFGFSKKMLEIFRATTNDPKTGI